MHYTYGVSWFESDWIMLGVPLLLIGFMFYLLLTILLDWEQRRKRMHREIEKLMQEEMR